MATKRGWVVQTCDVCVSEYIVTQSTADFDAGFGGTFTKRCKPCVLNASALLHDAAAAKLRAQRPSAKAARDRAVAAHRSRSEVTDGE